MQRNLTLFDRSTPVQFTSLKIRNRVHQSVTPLVFRYRRYDVSIDFWSMPLSRYSAYHLSIEEKSSSSPADLLMVSDDTWMITL